MKIVKHEFDSMQHRIIPLFLSSVLTQCTFLFFFSFVGKFDKPDSGSILTGYSGIVGLSGTVTMCVVSVYGAVWASKAIVQSYTGFGKNQTFLLPIKRSILFYSKLLALCLIVGSAEFIGMLLACATFIVSNILLDLVIGSLLEYWLLSIQISIIMVCVSVSVILISIFVGIYRSSSAATLICSVILVVVASNAIALLSTSYTSLMVIFAILLVLIVGEAGKLLGRQLENLDSE
ncbi:hypothetical protein LASUN_26740 [Lentilactobacillus sunkii]|jgi:hypothetical protein|uniref:ABC-2 family transporter protein n=1 Tax=Lentilactobacillus sunkii TaxID=481719 RepID=A0A1E7X8E8_9LACO|nr:hypothetical protein [Lentilactobacillus sunkii]OFA09407.1 hypothetical protein LASUN_26740 [Lentilactobacillus sunkii]